MNPSSASSELFNRDVYKLPIPEENGHVADKLVLAITCQIELDRTNRDDLALLETMELGSQATFTVSGTIGHKGFVHKAGEDGEPATTFKVALKGHSIERPKPHLVAA